MRRFRALLLLAALAATAPSHAAAERNILLIIADDLGLETTTIYPPTLRRRTEPPAIATPHLAALARQGVLFRNAWANPTCSPTRSTVMTGRYGFRTGMGWPIPQRGARLQIPPLSIGERTLPESFAASDVGRRYAMAMVGKWHLSIGRMDAIRYGWPDFVGPDPSLVPGAVMSYFHWPKVAGGIVRMSRTYSTTDLVDETIHRIRAARSQPRPYFVWLAFNAVHAPFHRPPAALHGRSGLGFGQAPKRGRYEAMVEALDREVGRLLREVDLVDTTVIFMSDNGTPRDIIAPPYEPAQGKFSLFEDGVRVPLLIAGAVVAEPGRIVDGLAQGVDLYPTILELAGIDAASVTPDGLPIDGVSLLPYLASATAPPVRATAYSEQFRAGDFENRFERAIRNHRFKYIARAPGLGLPHHEFFDLGTDPYERRNLLDRPLRADHVAELGRLRAAMHSLLATRCAGPCGDTPGTFDGG